MAVVIEHQSQEEDDLHCDKEAFSPRATEKIYSYIIVSL